MTIKVSVCLQSKKGESGGRGEGAKKAFKAQLKKPDSKEP